MTKKALGKGLKAFLPEEYGILKEDRFLDIDVDRLKPNPLQPLRHPLQSHLTKWLYPIHISQQKLIGRS